jgi:hypothetical protein
MFRYICQILSYFVIFAEVLGVNPCDFICHEVGVFDGHGPSENLPREFLKSESFQQNDIERALKEAFSATQQKCQAPSFNRSCEKVRGVKSANPCKAAAIGAESLGRNDFY